MNLFRVLTIVLYIFKKINNISYDWLYVLYYGGEEWFLGYVKE